MTTTLRLRLAHEDRLHLEEMREDTHAGATMV